MWAMRIAHEASLYDGGHGNCFVTLTYRPKYEATEKQRAREDHLPGDWSLKKEDFTKFMKRLRKAYPGRRIKYYQCGEYGSVCEHGIDLSKVKCPFCNLGRPHHHACLFNIQFDDLEPYSRKFGVTRYTSEKLEKLWRKGFVDVGELTFASAAYVARYVTKKITGVQAADHYEKVDSETGEITKLEPEYATMSNGIGKAWYQRFKKDFFPSDEVPVPGEGVLPKVPRYYTEMLKEEDPEMHEEVKEKRLAYRDENAEEYSAERLMAKYKVKKAQTTGLLKRDSQ